MKEGAGRRRKKESLLIINSTFCEQKCHLLLPVKSSLALTSPSEKDHNLSSSSCEGLRPKLHLFHLSAALKPGQKETPATVSMCHVIVTCRSMLWTLLSIVAAFGELIAFMSTDWLVGFPRTPDAVFGPHGATTAGEAYRPTLGIYGRCIKLPHLQRGILCGPYAIHFGEIASGFWQATSIFLAAGILLLCAVAFISVFTMCFQSIMKKSIFNVCGLLQGIAGEMCTWCIFELFFLVLAPFKKKGCYNPYPIQSWSTLVSDRLRFVWWTNKCQFTSSEQLQKLPSLPLQIWIRELFLIIPLTLWNH